MAKQAVKATTPSAEHKFPLTRLASHSRKLFNVSPILFTGATAKLDPTGEYTVDEIKKTIEDWKKKEVH